MELMHLMSKLKMEHLPGNLVALCEQAAKRDLDYRAFLTEALATEWAGLAFVERAENVILLWHRAWARPIWPSPWE